ncbi:MAG: FAD-binding protein [Pseudomonadota bacterium]
MRPGSEAELAEAVAGLSAPIEVRGGGTRGGLGRPVQAAETLTTEGLSGVSLYEPGALTLVAGAGTPLAEVEAALAAEGQRLPFEPMDHRGLLGSEGEPTIGGAVSCNVSGPRRVQAGACRDSLIGVRFVDGRGRAIKNGGRVMKNVTGYDLVKLLAGSYGTLGVLSEVAFKVLPAPEAAATAVLRGLDDAAAVTAMTSALTSPFDVSGAAHLEGETLVRVEGFEGSVAYRAERLAERLGAFGEVELERGVEAAAARWARVRDAAPFQGAPGAVWRVHCRPSDAPAIRAALPGAEAFYDWGGGLIWLRLDEGVGGGVGDGGVGDDGGAAAVRGAAAGRGHATLVRASAAVRASVDVFEPEAAPLARLSEGLRERFDPRGVLNPGRMRA